MNAAFFCQDEKKIEYVYGRGRRERIQALCDVFPGVVTAQSLKASIDALSDLEFIYSTWGMFEPSAAQLDRLPSLKAVFYAAGSVKAFAPAFLERGVRVFGGWGANAVAVADFTLGQILLATNGYFRNRRDYINRGTYGSAGRGIGNFEESVAILGAGMAGRAVIDRLQPFDLEVLVVDPYLSEEAAAALGVERVSLADAFRRALVVSNHLPSLPATLGMLTREHFASMRENAVFINTGRGATVVEQEMIEVLQVRSDLTALLDVTDPEPPVAESPFFTLPNVHLSTHLAGAQGNEVVRMADCMIEEWQALRAGRPLRYEITSEMLETMA
jgi:phosphoglycerate dehydrogenase-like enzyme